MKLINLLYDYEYDDIEDTVIVTGNVDIISVPDFVCENLDIIVQKFFDWVSSTREHGYFVKNASGHETLIVGTNEFVKWLNDNYSEYENQEIVVVEEHTKYNPNYPSAEF